MILERPLNPDKLCLHLHLKTSHKPPHLLQMETNITQEILSKDWRIQEPWFD